MEREQEDGVATVGRQQPDCLYVGLRTRGGRGGAWRGKGDVEPGDMGREGVSEGRAASCHHPHLPSHHMKPSVVRLFRVQRGGGISSRRDGREGGGSIDSFLVTRLQVERRQWMGGPGSSMVIPAYHGTAASTIAICLSAVWGGHQGLPRRREVAEPRASEGREQKRGVGRRQGAKGAGRERGDDD